MKGGSWTRRVPWCQMWVPRPYQSGRGRFGFGGRRSDSSGMSRQWWHGAGRTPRWWGSGCARQTADLVCVDMFRVYVSKLRAVAEEGVGQPRAERESRSVLVGKDTLVEILLMFEGRKRWAWAAVRFRWARERILGRLVLLEAQIV
jgi:hypothetical protein